MNSPIFYKRISRGIITTTNNNRSSKTTTSTSAATVTATTKTTTTTTTTAIETTIRKIKNKEKQWTNPIKLIQTADQSVTKTSLTV